VWQFYGRHDDLVKKFEDTKGVIRFRKSKNRHHIATNDYEMSVLQMTTDMFRLSES
jgi:intein-encoded DNA endonuclease-like protein